MISVAILEYYYADDKSEWDMIVSKGKKWIRKQKSLDANKKKELENKIKEMISGNTEEEWIKL